MAQRIAILGSTGSIGSQTLDIISRYPERFSVEILTAGNNAGLLARQARQFRPSVVVIGNKDHYGILRKSLSGTNIEILAGDDEIEQAAASSGVDVVVASIVGYSGLRPTVAAVKSGKKIALANKETLVVAGEIISREAQRTGSRILPVDSEHSAILQCLAGEEDGAVEKITLTASGGPFLNHSMEMLAGVKPEEALRHPNWDMGCKVTIDSASMMNKGLEVIEARWLFGLPPERISVIVHPQSVIHSFVHFVDGSVKAQLGVPDMRVPILYALTYPDRLGSTLPRLNFDDYQSMTFINPDFERFRNLSLAYEALKKGGNMCCIMNAANEMAVQAFLSGEIGFLQMSDVVWHTMENSPFNPDPDLDLLEISDKNARETALKYITKLYNRR